MTLPEIPDAAVQAEGQWAREDLEAAWPILYATALRHAAAEFVTEARRYSQQSGLATTLILHRLADEAVTGT